MTHSQRQYGIEWLRVWAMFFITFGHLVGNAKAGGVFSSSTQVILPFLLPLGVGAVDCFILITGYFSLRKDTCLAKFLTIYSEMVFYGLLCFALACFLPWAAPMSIHLIKSLIPLAPTQFNYWFVTKYLGLLLLSPFLNSLFDGLSRREKIAFAGVLCFLNLSLFSNGAFPWGSQYGGGWSLMWFICLYILGRTLREFRQELQRFPKALLFLIWTTLYVLYTLHGKFAILSWADLGYNFILTLTSALCLFLLASTWKNAPPLFLRYLSPALFSVYLLHANFFIRNTLEQQVFPWIAQHWEISILPLILLTFFFFATATLVDAGRRMLFHATGIDLCFTKAGDSVTSLIRDGYFIRNNEREEKRREEKRREWN